MLLCADSIMGESVCVQTRAGARMAPLPAAAGSGQAMPVTVTIQQKNGRASPKWLEKGGKT